MDTELKQKSYALPDGNIYYIEQGQQGENILLIHGSLCDYRYWRWQIEPFAENNTVLAPSLRGCWPEELTHPSDKYSIEQHSQDLISLLKKTGQKAHIIGHSRGASVATQMAINAPEVCSSIILADPGFKIDNEPTGEIFYQKSVDLLKSKQLDQALEYFVNTVNGDNTWQKMVPWFKEMANDNAMTLISQIKEASFSIDSTKIETINCPFLLINGKNSPKKYHHTCDVIQELNPYAERTEIALAAHGMNLANPRTFNKTVLEFIETN